jgi:hypothetical protein
MTPKEFKSFWPTEHHQLVRFPREAVLKATLSEKDKDFLINIGLPDSAAPFLDFDSKHALQLPTLSSFLGEEGDTSTHFRIIGFNGSGDPVCVDEAHAGQVVYSNHDDSMSVHFINSSIPQLAYSLLAFRQAVEEIVAAGGRDAFLEKRVPIDVIDRFIGKMEKIDPKAIAPNSFWLTNIS